MRKTIFSTLCIGLLLGGFGIGQARADDAKPMATISFSGYDNLMTDVECIGNLAGMPDLVQNLEMPLEMMTQGKGLAGLDKTRPWGIVVLPSDSPMPTGYGFIPVTKLEDLLAVLGNFPGMEVSDAGDGISEIVGPNGQTFFVKQQSDWTYVCLDKDGFAQVAADPVKLLGGDSATKYNLCVRLLFKNIPPSLRDMAVGFMQMGVQAGMQPLPGESDEDHALRMKVSQDSIKQVEKVLAELDTIMIGLTVDEKTSEAHLDLETTAIAGTDFAKQLAAAAKGKTAFGGFYQSDAALSTCFFGVLDRAQQDQMKNSFDMYRSLLNRALDEQELTEEESATAKQLTDDMIKVFEDSFATGKIDMGLALVLAPSKSTLIVGGSVADGAAVDKIVRDLAEIVAAEQPQAAKLLKLDAAQHAGVKFHTLAFPLPDDIDNRQKLVGIIGEEVNLVLGVGPKQIYFGAGADPLEKLKAAIDNSKSLAGTDVSPARMSLAVTPIVKLVGELADDFTVKMTAAAIASTLENAGGDDHIIIVGDAIPNGFGYRITLQKGILKILGMAPQMAGGGM